MQRGSLTGLKSHGSHSVKGLIPLVVGVKQQIGGGAERLTASLCVELPGQVFSGPGGQTGGDSPKP